MSLTDGPARVLALDVGGTKIATAVFTAAGAVEGLLVEPTRREEGPDAVIARLFALAHRSIEQAGVAGVAAVGISCGGPLDAAAGTLLSPPHLPGWSHVELGPRAAAEFKVPFALENDATAAALGQHRFGAGRGTSTMLYLTLSTGVGGGAIIDGRLHRGAAGNGGELGHISVRSDGRGCASCGRRGCLEAYCSGTSIAQRAEELIAQGRSSSLAGMRPLKARAVSEAAAAGDTLAGEVWDETTTLLGSALTDLTNAFEPELIVLGGGVTNAGALLLDPVRAIVARDAMPPAARACRIVVAEHPDLAGIVGAGAIGLDRAGGWLDAVLDDHLTTATTLRRVLPDVERAAQLLIDTYAGDGQVYTFGNGGSAADAQHLSGELIGHYRRERRPLPCLTLSADSSVLTGTANDYHYDDVFSRQVEALAGPGVVFCAFTTSGRSPNVVAALAAAKAGGAATILFTGGDGGPARGHADVALVAPSATTARVQEMHTLMLHLICERVDAWAAHEDPSA